MWKEKKLGKRVGINPVQLDFKEGITLDNGTQLMTAITALTVCDAENLIETAEIATALSLEALLGISDAFDERIHKVRARARASWRANIRKKKRTKRKLTFPNAKRARQLYIVLG